MQLSFDIFFVIFQNGSCEMKAVQEEAPAKGQTRSSFIRESNCTAELRKPELTLNLVIGLLCYRAYRQEDGQLEILYNSQLSFHQRLYTDLEAIFYHFRLCKPLFTITKQPLLYVRGMVPWACFQALSRYDLSTFVVKKSRNEMLAKQSEYLIQKNNTLGYLFCDESSLWA